MRQTNTRTITSRDISESQKEQNIVSPLGYKVRTVTMHSGSGEGPLTKEDFEDFLRKISRPLKPSEKEK